jgi:hypothetical protein
LGTSTLFAQVSIGSDYGCISGFPADIGDYALQYLGNLCIAKGGYPQMGHINPISYGTVQVCNKCTNLCNSYDALEEIQEKQMACEENCGKWSYSCREASWDYKILENCDRSQKYVNEYPQCQADSSQSSGSGNHSSSSDEQSSSSLNSSSSDEGNCVGLGQICSLSSGSSGNICRATADELTPVMADLIVDCVVGSMNTGNTHNYSIEPSGSEFCITGGCIFPGGSSGSDGGGGGGEDRICRSTASELTPIMAGLIVDCTSGLLNSDNTHDYNIVASGSEFCITGHCVSPWDKDSDACYTNYPRFPGDAEVLASSSYYVYHSMLVDSDPMNCIAKKGVCDFRFDYHICDVLLLTQSGYSGCFADCYCMRTKFISAPRYPEPDDGFSISYFYETLFPELKENGCIALAPSSSGGGGEPGSSSSVVSSASGYYCDLHPGEPICELAGHDEYCESDEHRDEPFCDWSRKCSQNPSNPVCVNPQPPPGGGVGPGGPGDGGDGGGGSSGSGGGDDGNSSGSGDGGDSSSSSKSAASSSSKAAPDKHNERGPDAVYTADDIFSSGLDNMVPGKCYSLNPDRGTQYGWINNNAQDGWWWVERPCDGSAPVEVVTPGGCKNNNRGANAVYTANDCFSDGLDNMEPGKCYSLNPDRGTQYGWINNNAQDSWWWREVSCGGGSNKCQDSPFLQKKSILEKDSEYAREDASYEVWKNKTQAHPETRRYLFAPKKNIVLSAGKEGYSEKGLLKTLPDGKECGKIGKDYGIVLDNGQCKGGNTCYWFDVDYYYKEKPITIIGNDNCICGDDSLIRIEGSFSYKLNLTINEIYYVRKGYVFLDGYKTTENDVSAIRNHELKHKQDNASIIKGSGSIPIDTTICKGNLLTFRKEIKEKLHSDIKFEYDAKAKTASDTFHQNCYLEGFCE